MCLTEADTTRHHQRDHRGRKEAVLLLLCLNYSMYGRPTWWFKETSNNLRQSESPDEARDPSTAGWGSLVSDHYHGRLSAIIALAGERRVSCLRALTLAHRSGSTTPALSPS